MQSPRRSRTRPSGGSRATAPDGPTSLPRCFSTTPSSASGSAAYAAATRAIAPRARREADYVSHTTPLTVAAELGILGLLAYLLLMAGSIVTLDRVRRVDEALGVGLAVVFLSLFVHALFYGGFFEDPIAWLVLGIAGAVLVSARAAGADRQPAA